MLPALGGRGVRGGRRGGRGRGTAGARPVAAEVTVASPSTAGRGRGTAGAMPVAAEDAVAGPSTAGCGRGGGGRGRGGAGELALLRLNNARTKRALSKLPASARAEYVRRKVQKQVEATVMPDAPAPKRARKDSPDRVLCRLVPGTPAVPPPPKLQPWQIKQQIEKLAQHLEQQQLQVEQTKLQLQQLLQSPGHADCSDGKLRADGEGLVLPVPSRRAQSPASSTSSIPESEHGGVPTDLLRPSTVVNEGTEVVGGAETHGAEIGDASMPHTPLAGPSNMTLDDCDTTVVYFDDDYVGEIQIENVEVDPASPECAFDLANDAPAFLPDDVNRFSQDFVQETDTEGDRLLTGLLTSERADYLTFDWNADPTTFTGRIEYFDSDSGPTFPVTETTTPLDIFIKYFDDEVMTLIVEMTNANLERQQSNPLQEHSRLLKAKKTTMDEMYVFLAVLILQGLHPVPVEKEYFFENGHLTLPYFKTIISYDRFILLKRILHFSDRDSETNAGTDNEKLRKLGPLLNLLRSRFKGLYLPGRDIAIDESLLKWHGRLSFAQKIATKAAKVGVKTYELCESKTGYCWDFIVYTGKGQTYGQTDRPEPEDETDTDTQGAEVVPTSATAKIVLELLKPLLNKGHTVVMDNFYNSPLLARYLKTKRTDCFGTLRVNREFVPEAIKNMKKSQMREGECFTSYCRDLAVTLWRDANVVAMISTRHPGEVGGVEKWGNFKYKPQVVLDYNQTMGGVDRKDQLLSSHPIERARNQAWYKKVFRRLLNYAILNAYICFKTANPSSLQRRFRHDLAEQLLAMTSKRPIVRTLTTVREVAKVSLGQKERTILDGNHFLGPGPHKAARCVLCKVSRSKYICKQCHVTLCIVPCFERFHS